MFEDKPTRPARTRQFSDAKTKPADEHEGASSEPMTAARDRSRLSDSHWDAVIDRATD
jgi:hypothetical protein